MQVLVFYFQWICFTCRLFVLGNAGTKLCCVLPYANAAFIMVVKCSFFLNRYLISWFMRYFAACFVVLRSLLVFPFVCRYMYLGCSHLALHILLNQMEVLVFNNFILVYLKLMYIFDCWALIIFILLSCNVINIFQIVTHCTIYLLGKHTLKNIV